MSLTIIRPFAEIAFAEEIKMLIELDRQVKPPNWQMSPWAVMNYIMGTTLANGTKITPKYFGDKKLVEIAIATLLSDRALLLTGIPGTAKTWLAEHLTAAISGSSDLLIQGTTGINEDALRYGWNYASLIKQGPTQEGLIPSPVMKAMESGKIVRIEELSRIPTEIQDALITILSEKTLPVSELNLQVQAVQGFNLIATSNDQDMGVYEMSSALKRRFNIIVLPLPATLEEEVNIVQYRIQQIAKTIDISLADIKEKQMEQLVTLFRELRSGKTIDGKQKIKSTQAHLSPAEAISIIHQGRIHSYYFDQNNVTAEHLVPGILNTLRQYDDAELSTLNEYNETILKKRAGWKEWYDVIKKNLD